MMVRGREKKNNDLLLELYGFIFFWLVQMVVLFLFLQAD